MFECKLIRIPKLFDVKVDPVVISIQDINPDAFNCYAVVISVYVNGIAFELYALVAVYCVHKVFDGRRVILALVWIGKAFFDILT